ncbi:hypothetical protein [Nocardia grenadensis]|uniref:hypothetical protein n=1 Tax=Nocardia grenadensis TaxID=931537 RepID=UPI003D72DD15
MSDSNGGARLFFGGYVGVALGVARRGREHEVQSVENRTGRFRAAGLSLVPGGFVGVTEGVSMSKDVLLFSDYHQIYVFDQGTAEDPCDLWDLDDAPAAGYLALGTDAVAIETGVNGYLVVAVEVTDGPPTVGADAEVELECSLHAGSGRMVLGSPTLPPEDGPAFDVPAGWLRLRVSMAWEPEGTSLRVDTVAAGDLDEDSIPLYSRDTPSFEVFNRVRLQFWSAAASEPALVRGGRCRS